MFFKSHICHLNLNDGEDSFDFVLTNAFSVQSQIKKLINHFASVVVGGDDGVSP